MAPPIKEIVILILTLWVMSVEIRLGRMDDKK